MSEPFELVIAAERMRHVLIITIHRLHTSQMRVACRAHPSILKQTYYIHNKIYFSSVICIIFPMARQPQWVRASSLSRLHDHTQTHHTRWDSSWRVIGPAQGTLLDNTQQSQQKYILAAGGIRIRIPNTRAVANPRLRPRGCWNRHYECILSPIVSSVVFSIQNRLYNTSNISFCMRIC
jgi:hypothetical protein